MGAPDILGRLAAAGVCLTRNGDKLIAIPREHLDDELRTLIRIHKAELMTVLGVQPAKSLPKDLQRRIEYVAAFHSFTPEQLAEAKEIASGDPENATVCFRHLLASIRIKTATH